MNMKVALSKFRCLKTTFHFIFILSRQYSTDIMKKQPTDHGVTAGLQKLSCTLRPRRLFQEYIRDFQTKNMVSYNRHKSQSPTPEH